MIDCGKFTGRKREICSGYNQDGSVLNMDDNKRLFYLQQWYPELSAQEIIDYIKGNTSIRGLGDLYAKGISMITMGKVQPCRSCSKKKTGLNNLVPFQKKIQMVDINSNSRRNLLFHLWPKENIYKWHYEQLKNRIHVFNGKKILAIAEDQTTVNTQDVENLYSHLFDEVIVVKNDPVIREGASFISMLEKVSSINDNEITFYCHGKGARHGNAFGSDGSTLTDWTELMYKYCLDDMEKVYQSLRGNAMTGCFKRYGQFKTPGNNRWHYSGGFYWFRNSDVFEREWRKMDRNFFAIESWPGLMFESKDTGCLFLDNADDLYKKDYWETIIKPKIGK